MRQALHSASGDKLFIVIPAYNESENILRVVEGWYPVVEKHNGEGGSRLVVIDDGSKDNTYEILCEYATARPLMTVITKKNSGHGPTVRYGYQYAVEHGADYVFQTDSDGQTLPSEFEQFWEKRNKYDLLIGWRNHRKDGFGRVVVTRVLRMVIAHCFHAAVKDANTPYRLMHADQLKEYLPLIPEDFFLSNVLLTVIYTRKKKNICYMPITFRPRQGGVNSINYKRMVKIGIKALSDFRRLNKEIDWS
ncbi:MAG: glycosyltransferase family 2 protein [Eubacteriales bacterium]|nr:glycosyltransferase family 2 protein [Eubacteriales bacterium]